MPSLSMVTAQISISLSAAVIQDINTHWLVQASGPVGFLGQAVADADTTITLAVAPAFAPLTLAQQALGVPVVTALLIDNEPMIMTAQNGAVLTVTRAASAFPFMALLPSPAKATHAVGASVMVLLYPDPWTMIAQEALRPWAQQVAQGLGSNSATFGAIASGSMS